VPIPPFQGGGTGFESRWGCHVIPGEEHFLMVVKLRQLSRIDENLVPLAPVERPNAPQRGRGHVQT